MGNLEVKWQATWGMSANRNSVGGTPYHEGVTDASEISMPSDNFHKVSVSVRDDAPLDPASGIQEPTIHGFSYDGVVQIGWDGSGDNVWELTHSDGSNIVQGQSFDDGTFVYNASGFVHRRPFLTSDEALGGRYEASASDIEFIPHTEGVAYVGATSLFHSTASQDSLIPAEGGIGSNIGLHLTKDGLSADVTTTFNTGWKTVGCLGVYLSGKDTTSLVQSGELVANASFDSDTVWTKEAGWTISGGEAVAAAAAANNLYQSISGLVVGKAYVVSVEILTRSAGSLAIRTSQGIGDYMSSTGTLSETVVATSTSWSLVGVISSSFSGTLGSISVKLADEDRSVKGNGLVVNGAVTRTQVAEGSELTWYSGWSAADFLEGPYNPDYDFGTGDFACHGWFLSEVNSSGMVFSRSDVAGLTTGLELYLTGGQVAVGCGQSATLTDGKAYGDGVPHFFVLQRVDGIAQLWLDGRMVWSASRPNTLTDVTASLRIGVDLTGAGAYSGLKISLVKFSNEPLSQKEIEFIHNDERRRFQPGASDTLYGASDAVTAIAQDPLTGVIHVGTPGGRSDFSGLVRVEESTVPITTQIAAYDGLILEQ